MLKEHLNFDLVDKLFQHILHFLLWYFLDSHQHSCCLVNSWIYLTKCSLAHTFSQLKIMNGHFAFWRQRLWGRLCAKVHGHNFLCLTWFFLNTNIFILTHFLYLTSHLCKLVNISLRIWGKVHLRRKYRRVFILFFAELIVIQFVSQVLIRFNNFIVGPW